MNSFASRGRYTTVTAAARIFALVVLASPVAFVRDYDAVVNVVLIAAVWTGATFAESLQATPSMPALVVETSLIAYLVALTLQESAVLLPALVIPFFIGGLVRGMKGCLEVLGVELAILAAAIVPNNELDLDATLATGLFTWLMAGVGFGLIGVFVRASKGETRDESRTSYGDARELLHELLDLSGQLDGGLDPVTISRHITELAREEVPLVGVTVHARTPSGEVTVVDGDAEALPYELDDLLREAFETGEPQVYRHTVALPVKTDASVVAVLTADVAPGIDPTHIELDRTLVSVSDSLHGEALKLDTALLFSAVREAATTEERQRLARELHDGVAQDLASFGYLIDDAVAGAESPVQERKLTELRTELTTVVAELRHSVFSLRNEAAADATLGERLAALASHLEARTGIVIDVVRDEGDTRLRPEVEAELLRIGQEAVTNAVRHARASEISVQCTVNAPHARITVADDGVGLGPGRPDSHGLRIMRERAERIGAAFSIIDSGRGTILDVDLGGRRTGVTTPLEGSPTP